MLIFYIQINANCTAWALTKIANYRKLPDKRTVILKVPYPVQTPIAALQYDLLL
jgi:hypothetical protein